VTIYFISNIVVQDVHGMSNSINEHKMPCAKIVDSLFEKLSSLWVRYYSQSPFHSKTNLTEKLLSFSTKKRATVHRETEIV